MKAYICDVCGKQEKPDRYESLVPPGWFTLYRRASAHDHTTGDLCSMTCVRTRIDQYMAAALAEEPVHA